MCGLLWTDLIAAFHIHIHIDPYVNVMICANRLVMTLYGIFLMITSTV